MAQSIRIKIMDKEKNVAVSGSFITASSIRHAFLLPPDAILKFWFESNGMKINCSMNESGTTFLLPDNWSTMEFFAQSNRVPCPFEVEKANRIKNSWENRVFRVCGNKLTGTCVLIDNRRALTAAHLSFKLNETYTIKGAGNQEFSVICVFICKHYDIAILQSDALPILELSMGSLGGQGSKYFMMGYPNGVDPSNPTITKGTIKGYMDNCFHLVGTPGWKRGYSGAPVFNDSGRLAGLVLGGTSGFSLKTDIQECLDSSAEQKYARILGIGAIIQRHSQDITFFIF
ncbi:hypothetical protein CAEBREN_02693 [Caenorhabditis brenneri]|uniref:Serine protease n=1 Tax=Caenorhabditis brenneri TaxID=135651 RepID=G0PDI3_CAEBE|nr:hypothetical protein CAEBREN_02693 [Caenorhabditis brenneri]